MNVFRSLNHRQILTDFLSVQRSAGDKLSFSALADLIGVQKTYVSRIMAGTACWSADQAFAIAIELAMQPDEQEYFLLLVEIERTGLESRRKALQKQLRELRRRNLRSHKALESKVLQFDAALMAEYFADPYHSLVHVYLSLAKYRKNMAQLARVLGLTLPHVQRILHRLEEMGVVRYLSSRDEVEVLRPNVLTPTDAVLVPAHQSLFRAFSLDRLHRCPTERKNTFSAVFSGDSHLQETLWSEFLEYLKKVEAAAQNSREDNEVFYLQFDLFPWAGGEA